MKKLLVTIIAICFLTGCEIKILPEKVSELDKDAYINVQDNIEVYSNKKVKEVLDTNVEIDDDLILDTNTIGENKLILSYTFNGQKKKYELKYNIVDTVKPIFISAPSSKYLTVGSDKNPCDDVNIADNYTREVKCEIEGNYDVSKVGTYNVKYVITDEANNTNERSLTINVVTKIPSSPAPQPSTPSPPVQFSWVMNKFKKDNTEFGLDVSRWQGDIDFEKVKNAGATFVMMRMGVSNTPDEKLAVDSKFRQNISRAKAAGLKVGVYIYTAAINDQMAKELADFVVDTLGDEKLDFPVVFDWENWSKFRSYKISIHDLNQTFLTFTEELKKHNLDTMIYGSKHYLEIMWDEELKNNYPVWLAHYTNSQTTYEGKYMMWQQCSDGRIDGIDGDVDIDILYK